MYIWDAFPGDKIRILPYDEIFDVVDGRTIRTALGTVLTLEHGTETTLVQAGELRLAREAEAAKRARTKGYYCVGDFAVIHGTQMRYHHTETPCGACVPEADYRLVRDIMRRDPFGGEASWWEQLPPGFNEMHLDDIFRVERPNPDGIAVLYWDAWRKILWFATGCFGLLVATTMLSQVLSYHLPLWIAAIVSLGCLFGIVGMAAILRIGRKVEIIREYWPVRDRIHAQLAAIDARVRGTVEAAKTADK